MAGSQAEVSNVGDFQPAGSASMRDWQVASGLGSRSQAGFSGALWITLQRRALPDAATSWPVTTSRTA